MNNIQAKWHTSISEIPKYFWEKNIKRPMIPFFEWDWLLALEQSHSVHSSTGWQSFHLALWKSPHMHISFSASFTIQKDWSPKRMGHQNVGGR